MNISSFYISKKHKLFENILLIFILSILSYFLVFSKTNYQIMSNIANVFLGILVPSLFPFILFSNILTSFSSFDLIANSKFNKIIQTFFRVSSYAASSIIFGFLFGYPNGARYVNELYEKDKISYNEAEYLLTFVNNASPTFILSSVGIGMFQNIRIGTLLLISHILASLIVGIIYRFKYNLNKEKKGIDTSNYVKNNDNIKHGKNTINLTFNVLYNSISKSLITLGIIFGFMTIFILLYNYIVNIIGYLLPINSYIKSSLLCIMEVSSGLNDFIKINISLKNILPFISFFLGFSSLSIIFQIFSCVYLNKFKLKNILKGKFMHGILSFVITYILVNIPYVYEYVNVGKEVSLNIDNTIKTNNLYMSHIFVSLIIFAIHILIFMFFAISRKKRLRIIS